MSIHNAIRAALVSTALLIAARPAAAQFGVIKTIKRQAADKVAEKKQKADSAIVARAGKTVDSTLEKSGRGVDTAVAKIGSATDTVLNRSERGVKSLAGGRKAGEDARIAADLADDGRVVLDGLHFSGDSLVEAASRGPVRALAKLIRQSAGPFLIEGHVAPAGGTAQEQTRSEAHARAVKAALVEEGVESSRLFVIALGASRPPAAGAHAAVERVEISRMH